MADLSFKSLLLPGVILLVALSLQAVAIKMITQPNAPDPMAPSTHPAPAATLKAPPVKPAEPATDPPHLAKPTLNAKPAHAAPDPEANTAIQHSPEAPKAPEAHGSAPAASPEAQTIPASPPNPMVSRIPPPIELDPPPAAAPTEAHLAPAPPQAAEPAALTGALLEPDWLKGRDSQRYTVQLYSGKDMAKLREIADSISGAAPPAYFVTASRSGPWYSLVVGDYPDFTAAQSVATGIAARSPTLKPWIRRFSEIQAKIR